MLKNILLPPPQGGGKLPLQERLKFIESESNLWFAEISRKFKILYLESNVL